MTRERPGVGFFAKIRESAFVRIDIASLVFFRIAFGLVNVWLVARVLLRHLIAPWWINAPFLFKYAGFSWVNPWPGNWLYFHWIALGVFAFFIAIGFLYRISTVLFFLSHTYFFLLDQGLYVNHLYLIGLFGFLFIFVRTDGAFSVDAWLRPNLRSQTVPAWGLWLFRIQMAAVYFFAGLGKLTPDWLHGQPMYVWLAEKGRFGFLDRFFHTQWAAYAGSYGSLLLDLSLAPLLLWRRTRVPAFFAALIFHLLNAWIFELDIFPWLAIAATTLFLLPSWPRRILPILRRSTRTPSPEKSGLIVRWKETLIMSLAGVYVAIQVLVPLRNFVHRGGIEWLYMEHRFSWQMMLQRHAVVTYVYVTDPNTGHETQVRPRDYLTLKQNSRMGWRPDMVRQFAHFLADRCPRFGPEPLRVEVRMFVSINGRKPQLFIDPNVDLAAEPRHFGRPKWLLEIHEPLPRHGQEFPADPFALPSAESDHYD